MKHTPGPWEVQDDDSLTSVVIEYGEICDIVQDGRHEKENLANAQLIAAAPDLLEACREALSFINNGIALGYIRMPDADVPDPAHKTPGLLRAAIAKAEGR